MGMRVSGDTLAQPCAQSTQSFTTLAWTGHRPSCGSLHKTLHALGLLLSLVRPVQGHEPGHQLWLTCNLFMAKRAASCLSSDCGPDLAQQASNSPTFQCAATVPSPARSEPCLGRVPPFQLFLPLSSAPRKGQCYLIATLLS